MECCLVYMPASGQKEAERSGSALIEERLAACVNILAPIQSLFRWDGRVQREPETAFLAKTTRERFEALRRRVRELHSYETPCIVALPLADGDADFLAWIVRETRAAD